MFRTLLVLVIGVGIGGIATAYQHEHGDSVKLLAARDIVEKLDGKEARASYVEVTCLCPGRRIRAGN
jgi:glycine/D-amino acid oxidase-like deaminating enzyme